VLPARTAALLSILVGVALEVGIAPATGRREPWDAALYWQLGMPAAAACAGAIGYLSPRGAWTVTALIMPAQVATMMVRSGEFGTLWPLTLIASACLSLPFVLMAWVGSRFRG